MAGKNGELSKSHSRKVCNLEGMFGHFYLRNNIVHIELHGSFGTEMHEIKK